MKKNKILFIIILIIIITLVGTILYNNSIERKTYESFDDIKNIKLIMNGIESGFFFNFNRLIHYLVVYPNTTEIKFNVRAKIDNHLPFIGNDEELFSKLFEPYKEDKKIDEVLDIDKLDWKSIPFAGIDGYKFYNMNQYKFEPYNIAFNKYIKLKPNLQNKFNKYLQELKKDCEQVIGIFVRSEALKDEQPTKKMPRREDYLNALNAINTKTISTKYFLRIDNNEDLDYYKKTLTPNYFLDMERAETNKGDAPHRNNKFLPLEELEKIYLEIALLSQCDYILHCSSNMVSSALFMNMNTTSIFVENKS
jgi:hypothetical protein